MTDSVQKPNPVPLINQPLVPDAIAPGGGAFTLVVNGTGLVPGSVVKLNAHERQTTFISNHQLTAVIEASDIATANTGSVTVVSDGPGGGTSNVVYFPVTNATSSVSFSETSVPTGGESVSIVAGDFNEDGKVDVVVSDQVGDTVSVLLGNGDGTFQPYVTYLTGTRPFTIGTADFNEDGHLDLVTNGRGVVCILLGNGDGTFGPHTDFGAIPLVGDNLQTADLNGDGHMDVAIANGQLEPSVSVFLGNGDGTLQPAVPYKAVHFPSNFTVGDYDRDGNLDLAVRGFRSYHNSDGVIAILHGKGDGSFRSIGENGLDSSLNDVIAADFNGDGKLDLVATEWGPDSIALLLGNGDGTFQSGAEYPTNRGPDRLAAGDLNGDGYLDLAVTTVAYGQGHLVSTLLGNGDGTFQPFSTYRVGYFPGAVVIADFNQDGRLDIATPGGFSTISILLQNSTNLESPPR